MKRWFTVFDRTTGIILRRVFIHPDMIGAQYDPETHDHIEGNVDDAEYRIDPETRAPVSL